MNWQTKVLALALIIVIELALPVTCTAEGDLSLELTTKKNYYVGERLTLDCKLKNVSHVVVSLPDYFQYGSNHGPFKFEVERVTKDGSIKIPFRGEISHPALRQAGKRKIESQDSISFRIYLPAGRYSSFDFSKEGEYHITLSYKTYRKDETTTSNRVKIKIKDDDQLKRLWGNERYRTEVLLDRNLHLYFRKVISEKLDMHRFYQLYPDPIGSGLKTMVTDKPVAGLDLLWKEGDAVFVHLCVGNNGIPSVKTFESKKPLMLRRQNTDGRHKVVVVTKSGKVAKPRDAPKQ